jgi:hypothetical protein
MRGRSRTRERPDHGILKTNTRRSARQQTRKIINDNSEEEFEHEDLESDEVVE